MSSVSMADMDTGAGNDETRAEQLADEVEETRSSVQVEPRTDGS